MSLRMRASRREPFTRARKLIKARLYTKAIRLLLDRKTDLLKGASKRDLNHGYYLVGDCYFGLKMYTLSFKYFNKSYAIDLSDWMALVAMADCLHAMRRYEGAIAYIERANMIEFRYINIYNLANIYFDMKEFDKAISLYETIPPSEDIFMKAKVNLQLSKERPNT